jgi:hypothetical protein
MRSRGVPEVRGAGGLRSITNVAGGSFRGCTPVAPQAPLHATTTPQRDDAPLDSWGRNSLFPKRGLVRVNHPTSAGLTQFPDHRKTQLSRMGGSDDDKAFGLDFRADHGGDQSIVLDYNDALLFRYWGV